MTARNGTQQRLLAAVALMAAALTVGLTWPGQLTTDTQTQLGEALHGPITDWHPPITVWLWRLIGGTGGAMLVLQVALHWLGVGCFALSLARAGRTHWAWIMLLVGLSPISLSYIMVIQKDTLLASLFVAAFGLAALSREQVLPGVLGFLGALSRWNGIFAYPPLFFTQRPDVRLPGMLIASILGAALLIPVAGFINHNLLMARRTGVERSLQFYDLVGVAHYSDDRSVLPPGAEKVLPCYTPLFWDKLASPQCGFAFSRLPLSLTSIWLHAILRHPVAYAEHRLRHFDSEIFLLVPPMQQCVEAPAMHRCDMSRHGLVADFIAKNALLWPALWLAIGIALLFGDLASLPRALVLSGVLYGFSYLLVGVAANFRYFYWTEIAIQVAVVHQIGTTGLLPNWRWAGMAALLVLVLGYAARLVALL